jgi:regulatory protein
VSDAPDPCYLAALRILKYRFNSEAELRRKLRGKQFEKSAIDAVIVRLHEEKWLDDERFAGAFVRTRANRRIGGRRIVLELQAAGIDRSSAAKAVEENVDPEREREALLTLGAKRARALIRRHGADFLSTAEGRNKLTGYLLKQGYDAALVADAVAELKIEN